MKVLNLSEKNKVITWTPPHTASRLAWKIFDNFDFSCYDLDNRGTLLKNSYDHNHYIGLPKNHHEYKVILTCRNPYTQSTSGFNGMDYNKVQDDFSVSLENRFHQNYHLNFISHLRFRKPDYFVRVENLLEDYLKIPFIRESEFYKSGDMEKLINKNPYRDTQYYHRPILDKRLADLIYYNNIYYFDMLGYDKNSWKE